MAQSLKNLKLTSRKNLSAEDQEKALQSLYADESKKTNEKGSDNKDSKETVRVTIDFPQATHDLIKAEMNYTGQTIKGFVSMLVREYFEKNQR